MAIIPIEKTAKKVGKTTVSGGGGVIVSDGSGKPDTQKDNRTVAARDYTTSKGYSGIVDWDGKNVLVGGVAISPEHISNGIAHVPKTELDSAIGRFEERNGIIGNSDVVKKHDDKYGSMISDALDSLVDRDSFSYDPNDDPAYLAYKEQYEQLADEAYRRVLNDNNTSVTGASGAVLAEAMDNRDALLKEVTARIPELAMDAYERYEGETQRLANSLDSVTDVADSYYDKVYASNRDAIEDAVKAGEVEREEKQRWTDNAREDEKSIREAIIDSYEIEQLANEAEYYPYITDTELENTRLSNESKALDNAITRGFFISADEYSLPWLSEYRTDTGYSIDPMTAIAALEYDKAYSRQRGTINAKLGR